MILDGSQSSSVWEALLGINWPMARFDLEGIVEHVPLRDHLVQTGESIIDDSQAEPLRVHGGSIHDAGVAGMREVQSAFEGRDHIGSERIKPLGIIIIIRLILGVQTRIPLLLHVGTLVVIEVVDERGNRIGRCGEEGWIKLSMK